MLEREGIKFDKRGRCDLERYLWIPREEKKEEVKATLFRK
jgi:hypothetical protein